jgi:hypothetical protein
VERRVPERARRLSPPPTDSRSLAMPQLTRLTTRARRRATVQSRRCGPTAAALLATSLAATLALGVLQPAGAGAEAVGAIAGVAFDDANRDGVRQADEVPFGGHRVYLSDGTGKYLAWAATDASGRYAFAGLADGAYQIEYAPQTWWEIRETMVPTTTVTIRPRHDLTLAGQATADFGWRRIVTSTDKSAPISEVMTAVGLRVASYNDAVDAGVVAVALAQGRLLGDETAHTTVHFAYGGSSACATGVGRSGGAYTSFDAACYVSYASWLDDGDRTLFHEYGHAWGLYHTYLVQQDPELTAYLEARGLTGDSRLDTSHAWSRQEILAEDYRHLFGSPTARQGGQMNRDIPLASEVPGLEDFLATAFRTAPGGGSVPAPAPASRVHVADLDGRADAGAKGQWVARTAVSVLDDSGAAVNGAVVSVLWKGARGEGASASCTTDAAGWCEVGAPVKKTTASVRFSVDRVAAGVLAYASGDNADPDGDSDGTTLVVSRP